jgi:hypothetical protein
MLGKCDNCGLENVEVKLITLDSQEASEIMQSL